MAGVGLFLFLFGYALLYWGIQSVEGNNPPSLLTYVVPFAK